MRYSLLLCLTILTALSTCWAHDLTVGTSYNARLIWQEKAEYGAYPLMKRIKQVFYSDSAQQIIKGIIARDLDHTEGTATITAGGVGSSFVNIRLKSGKGKSLNYQIEIYV